MANLKINNNPLNYLFSVFNQSFPSVKFKFLSTKEIEDIINSLKSKDSHGYDEISIKILKASILYISSPLTYLIFERKILRRIYGPVMDLESWRIRTNQQLYQLCGENDIVKFCKLSRLRWAGHVIRQDDDDLSRRVLLSEPGGKRPRGRPRLRWEDGVEEDVVRLGCRNWKIAALNRKGWKKVLKEAEVHPRL
jgi:hypothetical protein